MRIGFVGTGTITRAIVTGLLHIDAPFEHLYLSPRNAEVGSTLATLDQRITVCGTNQEVVDASDVVCLAVVPQIAAEVLGEIDFDGRHHVISFIAGVSVAEMEKMIGKTRAVVRAIPLPAVSVAKGSTAICPPNDVTRRLFAHLGTPVEVADERKFDALSAVTATMASFYAVLETQAQWLVEQGMEYSSARAFLAGYSVGLADETTKSDKPFSALVQDSMTPGGINEQLHGELSEMGAYAYYSAALNNVLKRIKGQ